VRGREQGIPGERRIRRTITYTLASGAKVVRTIVITGREDIAALNAICRRSDGFGEQRIPPKLSECALCALMHYCAQLSVSRVEYHGMCCSGVAYTVSDGD
jgi:hypothetical protein